MSNEHEFTARYEGLVPYPDPETMCQGECEGVGAYPVFLNHPDVRREGRVMLDDSDVTPAERERWLEAHKAPDAHTDGPCDGWHWITCPDCEGSGKRRAGGKLK